MCSGTYQMKSWQSDWLIICPFWLLHKTFYFVILKHKESKINCFLDFCKSFTAWFLHFHNFMIPGHMPKIFCCKKVIVCLWIDNLWKNWLIGLIIDIWHDQFREYLWTFGNTSGKTYLSYHILYHTIKPPSTKLHIPPISSNLSLEYHKFECSVPESAEAKRPSYNLWNSFCIKWVTNEVPVVHEAMGCSQNALSSCGGATSSCLGS